MTKSNRLYQVGSLFLIRRGDYFYIHGMHDGRRIRKATGTDKLHLAKLALDDLYHELESGWRVGADTSKTQWKSVAKAVCSRQRVSARARGIPFQITAPDVYRMMRETGFRCEISGIAFSKSVEKASEPDPWAPSIDRIESRHGYLKDNTRIVCLAANLAMNRWGYDVLLRLALAVTRNASVVEPETSEALTQKLINCDGGEGQDAEINGFSKIDSPSRWGGVSRQGF